MPFADGPPVHPSALRNETAAAVSLHFGGPVLIAAGVAVAAAAGAARLADPAVPAARLRRHPRHRQPLRAGHARRDGLRGSGLRRRPHDPRAASALRRARLDGCASRWREQASGSSRSSSMEALSGSLYECSLLTFDSTIRQARERTSGEPTRHEWIREIGLVLAGLLVYFGVRAATTDDAGPATAHARSLVASGADARDRSRGRPAEPDHRSPRARDAGQLGLHLGPLAPDRRERRVALPPPPGGLSPDAHRDLRLGRDRHDHLPRLSRRSPASHRPRPDRHGHELLARVSRAAAPVADGSLRRPAQPALRLGPARRPRRSRASIRARPCACWAP